MEDIQLETKFNTKTDDLTHYQSSFSILFRFLVWGFFFKNHVKQIIEIKQTYFNYVHLTQCIGENEKDHTV